MQTLDDKWMNDIFTMLKILIFGGSTLLTPDPVDINTEILAIKPESSIEAITNGASLNIDVSQYILSEKMDLKKLKINFHRAVLPPHSYPSTVKKWC
jgi:hypothetical protein